MIQLWGFFKLVSTNTLFHASTCSIVMQHSTGMNPGRCVNACVCMCRYMSFPQTDRYYVIFDCKLPAPMYSHGDSGTKSVSICFLFICKGEFFCFVHEFNHNCCRCVMSLCMFSSECMGYYSHCLHTHHY